MESRLTSRGQEWKIIKASRLNDNLKSAEIESPLQTYLNVNTKSKTDPRWT